MIRVLMVFDPLKCTCMPFLLHVTQSLYVRNHHENVPVVVVVDVPITVVGVLIVCWDGFIVVTVPVLEILSEFVECPGRKVAAV